MAPSKNTKRAAESTASRPQKKTKEAKVEPPPRSQHEVMLDGIMDTLAAAGHLPAPCAAMFKAIAPHSLGTKKDLRVEAQVRVVDMIEEALNALRGEKEQVVTTENNNVEEAQARKAELDKAAEDADAQLSEKSAAVKVKDDELADADTKLAEAKAAFVSVEAEVRARGAEHAAHEREFADLQAVLQNFEALRSGAEGCESDGAKYNEAVCIAAGRLNLESSLITSLPLALEKKCHERGPFDEVVFQEVAKLFDAELHRLRSILEDGAPAAAQNAQEIAASQAVVDGAEGVVGEKRAEFDIARTDRGEQKRAKDEAVAAARAFELSLKQSICAYDDAQAALNQIAEVIAKFELLRDAVSKEVVIDTPALETAELGA